MSSDMTKDIFAEQSYGKAALYKIGEVADNFRLYNCKWVRQPDNSDVMQVTGAYFRKAQRGVNKGKLSIKIKGTDITVIVTQDDMAKFV